MASFEFDGQALHIRLPGPEIRIRWHPQAIAQELTNRGRWRECWPGFRILRPAGQSCANFFEMDIVADVDTAALEQKRQAFSAFRAAIPPDFVARVERFGSHQWALLQLIRNERAAFELAATNPVLTYCLANNAEVRALLPGDCATVLAACHGHGRQRSIARWLGFPDRESVVRLLRKIRPEAVDPSLLRRLRMALRADDRVHDLLAHHAVINAGMLELVTNACLRPLATPRLLADVACIPSDQASCAAAWRLQDALMLLRKFAPHREVHPFTAIAAVEEFAGAVEEEHLQRRQQEEEAARRAVEAQRERRRARNLAAARRRALHVDRANALSQEMGFPAPPVPGTPEIEPITTEGQLMIEGAAQHNCVATYAPQVRAGRLYIYRVMHPQRATLSIVPGPAGIWRRNELKLAGNRSVRRSTKNAVDRWLAQQRPARRRDAGQD